jgi:sulfate transport system permease protein
MSRIKQHSVLPGFGLGLGYTLLYLSLIVLIPLSALLFKTSTMSWADFYATVTSPRVMASYQLTFGASLIGALLNLVFGILVAWVLVRYSFPGKRLIDALVDLPFALPTAVAGIALTADLRAKRLVRIAAGTARHQGGVHAAGRGGGDDLHRLPFVVRTLQPVLEDLEIEVEEAAGQPRCFALADVAVGDSAGVAARAAHRISRWHLRALLVNTARSFSSPATCR